MLDPCFLTKLCYNHLKLYGTNLRHSSSFEFYSSTKALDKESFASILFKNITVADLTPWYPPHWGLVRWVVGARSLWKRSSRPPPTPPRPAGPGPGSAACSQETLTPCSLSPPRAPRTTPVSLRKISAETHHC